MSRSREQRPLARLLGYIRLAPGRYTVGIALTLAYAVMFQLIPLQVRSVVAALEEIGAGRAAVEAARQPALWLVIVSLVFATFRFSSRIVLFRLGRQIEYRLRNDYFEQIQRLPASFFARHRTGDLMSRAINDINSVRLFLGMGVLNVVQTPVLFLGALIVLLRIDPLLTFWALLPFPLFILVARVFARHIYLANLAGQEQLGDVSTVVQESAAGALLVRTYGLGDRERQRFADGNDELYRRMLRVGVVQTTMGAVISILPAVAVGMVLWFGGRRVEAGLLASEDLWVFWTLIGMLTFPTVLLGWVLAIVQRGFASLVRLGEVLDADPMIADGLAVDPRLDGAVVQGALSVRDLSFTYPRQSRSALEGVSFELQPGQTLGVVGPVGGGKTTLLAMLPRLFEAGSGEIRLDDRPLAERSLGSLRRSIAMVPQDSFLFSTTVLENLRFGRPEASLEEVREAARKAMVLEEIERFPEGFETMVGERGITLSGGQRQRIALARALLVEAPILLLDDALASVDHETEEEILGHLDDVGARRTVVVAAHRLSAVRHADEILVLDEGTVRERGSHDELVELGGVYAQLYDQQRLQEELEELGSAPLAEVAVADAVVDNQEAVG